MKGDLSREIRRVASRRKTPEIRAIELFRLVNGPGDSGGEAEFNALNPALRRGWIKLGKHVLSIENKWAQIKPFASRSSVNNL